MTLAAPRPDFARRQVLLRLPMADGPSLLDMKQASLSMPLHSNDARSYKTPIEDEEYLLTMWENQQREVAVKSEPACWSDWPDDNSMDAYLGHHQSNGNIFPSESAYRESYSDSTTNFFDPMQLPTPPSELDLVMNQADCHIPDLFPPISSMDIYSMNGMWQQEFPSDFQNTSDSLPEMAHQPLHYFPPSPTSDVSASSFGSLPTLSRQCSSSSYYSTSSYPSTPSSSSSCSPQMKQESPKQIISRSTSRPSTAKSTTASSSGEGNALRPHPCLYPECGRWFTRSYTRNVHMLTHKRNNDPKPFACSVPGCSEGFSRRHDRLRHESRTHGRGSDYRCPVCTTSRYYSSQTTLERHISEKHHKDG